MNRPPTSIILPCVASFFITIFLLFIQDTKALKTQQHFGNSRNHDYIRNRFIRSNQNDQNTTTPNNNQLQSYYPPSKQNNVHSQFSNAHSNVSQTSSTPQSISYTTPSLSSPINNPISVTPTATNTTYSSNIINGYNCSPNNPSCQQQCHGRTMLNKTRGFITDGYGNYSINIQCTWLIDSGNNNSLIRLRFSEFNTECNYDYLYIFDGDSIFSPLVAAFSGILKPTLTQSSRNNIDNSNSLISTATSFSDMTRNDSAPNIVQDDTDKYDLTFYNEIVIRSGKAFIYFHSDTAQSMPGFNLTYSINSCPFDCSSHGTCDAAKLQCNCDPGFKGQGCQIEICPNNCSVNAQTGRCDKLLGKCICIDGYSGSDCSKKIDQGVWTPVENELNADLKLEGRSFHQSLVVDNHIWVLGGKTALNTNSKDHWSYIIDRFNLESNQWVTDRIRAKVGLNELAELVGHTAIYYDKKILIYGGMLPNGSISNALIVYDTLRMTSETSIGYSLNERMKKLDSGLEDDFVPPLGVVGHSCVLVGQVMYIFFGYNPLYGYLDIVQKYNIMDNTWTIVDTRGSSVEGSIGHSSVYDENSKLILIYGGHHSHRSNYLYSYDPWQDTWRLLQPGPYPRYYHRSLITNGLMLVMGGNSYNASSNPDACDDCFDSHTLMYDLNCIHGNHFSHHALAIGNDTSICDSNCWQVINDPIPGVLQRYGHTVIKHQSSLFLFGGFNGLILNTLYQYKIPDCLDYSNEKDCKRPKLALKCDWNQLKSSCHVTNSMQKQSLSQAKESSLFRNNSSSSSSTSNQDYQCSVKLAQSVCENRLTCKDCLYTNYGCRWCGNGQCRFDKCKSSETKAIVDPSLCYGDETNSSANGNFLSTFSPETFSYKHDIYAQREKELSTEIECRRYVNCYLCQTKSYCSWQSDHQRQVCSFLPPSRPLPTPTNLQSSPNTASLMHLNDAIFTTNQSNQHSTALTTTSSPINLWKHVFDSPSSFSNSTLTMMDMLNAVTSYHSCESPCFRRKSCRECIQNKCIWCDTSNECIDSSAYFAYYPIGQCMHYVAHASKCQGTLCSEIETCDQCQKNPKCGWIDDDTGRGIGKCVEGTSSGPLSGQNITEPVSTSLATTGELSKSHKWYFYTCPLCQCNGHSTCRPGTNICQKGCSGHTEGNHCEKCIAGYYGNPINGGVCRECKCNGHASSCNKETGKCHCSTKGIIGHSCNQCDEQNHYIGDPTAPSDGTCYYNLTTDYQYTFNMSKADDYFYSDINFMNVPMKRDVDVDFTIVCSSLALVNITSGTPGLSYRYSIFSRRSSLHTGLECGSFRLKFPYDEHLIGGGSNYTFYVHVYRFQTPFVLQIAFSQHRTLDLWQFFFTFASCFLFLFVMAGVVWKLKQKYDLYRRRQQHVIEMEQMASRPFATILLELTGGFGFKRANSVDLKLKKNVNNLDQTDNCRVLMDSNDAKGTLTHGDEEPPRSSRSTSRISLDKFHEVDYHKLVEAPSPISVEPCSSGKAGILSLFVQLPGRPNLAIGSALVSLSDDSSSTGSNNLGNNCDKVGP